MLIRKSLRHWKGKDNLAVSLPCVGSHGRQRGGAAILNSVVVVSLALLLKSATSLRSRVFAAGVYHV